MRGRSSSPATLRPHRERRRSAATGERLVDRAARTAAGGLSRRRFAQLGLVAVASQALPGLAWPAVARSETKIRGLCKTAPAGTCPPGRVPGRWTPESTQNIHSGIPSTFNGCGPESGVTFPIIGKADPVPDEPLGIINLFGACKSHDCCYGTCGSDQRACDQRMHADAVKACLKRYGFNDPLTATERALCLDVARFYYGVVSSVGAEAWAAAQATACFSCVPECDGADLLTDRNNCGACGNACADEQRCVNGQCVGCDDGLESCGDACCDPETQLCFNGQCVRKCADDEYSCGTSGCCRIGEVCVDGRCVKPDRCEPGYTACGDYDCCGPGHSCVDGECTRTCGPAGPECPRRQECCWTRINDDNSVICCPKGTIAYYYPLSLTGECVKP